MYALLGATLKHSISPQIHERIFREYGLEERYILLERTAEQLEATVKNRQYKGFNVTIPYKVQVLPYLDELSPEAAQIGAVNTIEYRRGRIIGHNTDYWGFDELLQYNSIDVTGQTAVILGFGGSTKMVAAYLHNHAAKQIYVVSRAAADKKPLDGTKLIDYAQLRELEAPDIVINTTPNGMYPHIDSSPLAQELLAKFKTAVDLIYNPAQTLFLKSAEARGLKTANGLRMLISQAVYAQEIWQERKLSKSSIQKIITEIGKIYE